MELYIVYLHHSMHFFILYKKILRYLDWNIIGLENIVTLIL